MIACLSPIVDCRNDNRSGWTVSVGLGLGRRIECFLSAREGSHGGRHMLDKEHMAGIVRPGRKSCTISGKSRRCSYHAKSHWTLYVKTRACRQPISNIESLRIRLKLLASSVNSSKRSKGPKSALDEIDMCVMYTAMMEKNKRSEDVP